MEVSRTVCGSGQRLLNCYWPREEKTNNLILDITTGTAASTDDDAVGILGVEIERDRRVVELDGALVESRGHGEGAIAPVALVSGQ